MENQIRELQPQCHRSSSTNNDDNIPAQDQNQPEEPIALLPELWTKIFLYLWDKEEDLESLESCRFVSHQFQQLVDNLPLKPDRNPWFKFYHQRYPFLYPLYHARATEFVSDEDVIKFLKETPSPESAAFGCSPFHRHHTVRLHKFRDNLILEGRNFGMIFQQHGEHIKKLIYLPNKFPNPFSNLSRLMTTMANLQTLVVDLSLLHADRRRALRGEEIPNDLNNLVELVISREDDKEDFEDEATFAKLAIHYGQQIKYITLSSLSDNAEVIQLLDAFPNLEELKVESFLSFHRQIPADAVDFSSAISWPKLKRLALAKPPSFRGTVNWFQNTLSLVKCFSRTLEQLSLDVGPPENDIEHRNDVQNRVITRFPNLRELILPFHFMGILEQDNYRYKRLGFQLPQISSLILQDLEAKFQNEDVSEVELRKICEPFWRRVPTPVQIISVRTERFNEQLGKSFPMVFKCTRDPPANNRRRRSIFLLPPNSDDIHLNM